MFAYWRTRKGITAHHYTDPLWRLCLLIRPPLPISLTIVRCIVCSVSLFFFFFFSECFVSGVIVRDCAASMFGLSVGSCLNLYPWVIKFSQSEWVTHPHAEQDKERFYYMKSMGEKLTYSQRIVKFRASYDETVFRLLESMGELFTHSQRTGFIQYFAS